MFFFFMACMSTKIAKMEQEIEALQEQNAALEARVTELEADVKEMEEPVNQMKAVMELLSTMGFSSSRSSRSRSDYSSRTGPSYPKPTTKVPENFPELLREQSKEALVTEITITQEQLKLLEEPDELSKMLRAVPHRSSEGYVDGYRLSGIRRGSLPDQLGIKNGDILMAINEKPVNSMEAMMDRYQETKDSSSFTFLVVRRGQRQILSYTLEE